MLNNLFHGVKFRGKMGMFAPRRAQMQTLTQWTRAGETESSDLEVKIEKWAPMHFITFVFPIP